MKNKKIFSGIMVAIGMLMAAQAQDWNGGGAPNVDLYRDGNVGIGLFSPPAYKLELDLGDMNILGGYGIRFSGIYGIRPVSTFSSDFILGSGGNFGIGMTPTYKLDVDGDVNIPSAYTYKIDGIEALAYKPAENNLFIGPTNPLSLSTGFDNVFLGLNSGYNVTGGYSNIFMGKHSGYSLQNGSHNVYLGNYTAPNITYSLHNIIIGDSVAVNLDDGFENVIMGNGAAKGISYLFTSTLIGEGAGAGTPSVDADTTYQLTAVGWGAGKRQKKFSWGNAYFGLEAGSLAGGALNLALGQFAGGHVSGSQNIAIGHGAGLYTPGSRNIAIGVSAETSPSVSTKDAIAMGHAAKAANDSSISIGASALSSGISSIAIGANSRVTADNAVALGNVAYAGAQYSAAIGRFSSSYADYSNAIGAFSYTTGDYSTAIGTFSYTSADYSTALGANSYVTSSYSTVLGDVSTSYVGIQLSNPSYNLEVNGTTYSPGGVWTASDKRFKKNITTFTKARTLLNQLEPMQYEYRDDIFYTKEKGDTAEPTKMRFPEGNQYGFLAQDLEKVLPNAVMTRKDGYKAVNYQNLIPVMVQGIQEQDKVIEEDQKKIADLEISLAEMKEQNKLLVDAITEIKAKLNITEVNSTTGKTPTTKAYLEQNSPNPFSENTVVKYFIPETVANAKVIIRSEQAVEVLSFGINHKGYGNLIISANTLNTGSYTCELYIENKLTDIKKMLLVK